MNTVRDIRRAAALTQSELAQRAGTSQPAVAAYESGARSPNLRTLRRMARSVGLDLEISLTPALTREERRSLWLHEAIALRLEREPDVVLERARSNLARMAGLHPDAADLLDEWARILEPPAANVIEAITSIEPRARELRQVTPFAGVLDAAERAQAYREFRRSESAL